MPLKTRVLNEIRKSFIVTRLDRLLPTLTSEDLPLSTIRAKLAPNNYQYPQPTLRTVKRHGINYELDISDYMQWCMYFRVAVEPRDALLNLLSENNNAAVIDVGSNIGEVLLRMAQKVGTGTPVLGFEPDPRIYQKALRNISLNGFSNVQLHNVALGSTKTSLPLYAPCKTNSGGNRLVAANQNESKPLCMVQVLTLDDFIEDHKISSVQLIKVDIEGFEIEFLKGARRTIKRYQPRLFIEVSDANLKDQGGSARELVTEIEKLGYRHLSCSQTGAAVSVNDKLENCHFDLIAQIKIP